MILLTDKCRQSFDEYLRKNDLISTFEYSIINKLSSIAQDAYVLDFFDKEKIFINIKSKFGSRKGKEVFQYTLRGFKSEFMESRQKATEEAIKIANNIYNKKPAT